MTLAHARHLAAMLAIASLASCASSPDPTPPIREIYSRSAQEIGPDRNPVVVIPGILGSRLVTTDTRQVVWGAFTFGAIDTDYPEGARVFALPMQEGVPLRDLTDNVEPDGVLESLEADVGVLRVTAIEPYRGIIQTLAAGRYVDRDITRAAARRSHDSVDYAGLHYTCFQFDYDWRRDLSEQAAKLDALIDEAIALASKARGKPTRVDVVAHSMGGLLLQYYLRYGPEPLPDDGSLPPLTWAGARKVERAMIVGTPGSGSVLALTQMVEGVYYAPTAPEYRPAIVGTVPAIYQLLPRERHARVVDAKTGEPLALYDAATWERLGWGLADPEQDRVLQWLMPDEPDRSARRRIALDHLKKCLARAEQFHRAIDRPIPGPGSEAPPPHLSITLALGDAIPTPSVVAVDASTGRLLIRETAPGDGTVTRASALADERPGSSFSPRLRTPVRWDDVDFIPADHLGLTTHPVFVNALLFRLLEQPEAR